MTLQRNFTNGDGEQMNKQVSTCLKISAASTLFYVPPTGPNSSLWIQMRQILLWVSLSAKNSLMDDTQLLSTHVHSSQQKRITTSMIKKWQPSSTDSNVAAHTFSVLIIQLWSTQTIKTYNTSANHKKLRATKPDGWSSSKISTIV